MFSKTCEYGIRAMVLMTEEGRVLRAKELAKKISSPESFTAKILQRLNKEGLLKSVKGPQGGYSLSRPAEDISLASIVKALDGEGVFINCVLGLPKCNAKQPCPLHNQFGVIRDNISHMLRNTNLYNLHRELPRNQSPLNSWLQKQ